MKDIKTIINARVAMGGVVAKNVTIQSLTVLEQQDNGRCGIICRLDKDVPSMIQVTQAMIDNAEAAATAAEEAVKTENDAEKKAELQTTATELRAYANKLDLDAWIKGESNVIFTSNFELLSQIRQNPKTAFAAKMIQQLPELLEDIFSFSKVNILAEDVNEGTEYCAPFSSTSSTVPNNSVYHTIYNAVLGEDAEAFMKELRRRHMDRLMAKLDKAERNASDDDDDED